jgi:hypothetical protein
MVGQALPVAVPLDKAPLDNKLRTIVIYADLRKIAFHVSGMSLTTNFRLDGGLPSGSI